MKYTLKFKIDLPRERVFALFDDPGNLKHWQPGFTGYEQIRGRQGQPGSRASLRYKRGKSEIEIIETINLRKPPELYSATYATRGVWNSTRNIFTENKSGKTIWTTHNEFRFTGFMKVRAAFMRGAFKKQSIKYMKLFKEFAEKR